MQAGSTNGFGCQETSVGVPWFVVPSILVVLVVGIVLIARVNRGLAKILAIVLAAVVFGNLAIALALQFVGHCATK